MKSLEAVFKTEAEIRRQLILDTMGIMEFIDESEEDLRKNDEGSIRHTVAKSTYERNITKFERNIKLLGVLRKEEIGE